MFSSSTKPSCMPLWRGRSDRYRSGLMKVLPTLDGGLRLEIENRTDWQVLLAITLDGEGDLAGELTELMDEESMWEDIVEPELRTHFSDQLNHVQRAVQTAKKEALDPESGEIQIPKEDSEIWYGSLNQARLALEEKYKFGSRELIDPSEVSGEKRSAYFRDRFYFSFQSILLDYILD